MKLFTSHSIITTAYKFKETWHHDEIQMAFTLLSKDMIRLLNMDFVPRG